MDRTIWLTIILLWAACACQVSEAWGGCMGQPCSDVPPVVPCTKPNHVCGAGFCRKCFCEPNGTCFWNSSSHRTECTCDTGYDGRVCDCGESTECRCPDVYSFGSGCSDYSGEYKKFPRKEIDFNVLCPTSRVDNFYQCRLKCINMVPNPCNVFEYRSQQGTLNNEHGPWCKVCRVNSLIQNNVCIKTNPHSDVVIKKCLTCTL